MKINSVVFWGSAAAHRQFPGDGRQEVAFIGRSNVGKSSLINCLVGRKKLVKTSRTPGKTQLVNFFLVNDAFYFTDLPGFGYAKVPLAVRQKWRALLQSYFKNRPVIKGVCWLFDIRREPGELDFQTLEWLTAQNLPYRLIFTKADKFSSSKAKSRSRQLAAKFMTTDCQTFSTPTRQGKTELWDWIEATVNLSKL